MRSKYKQKMKGEGQACRKCATPVHMHEHSRGWRPKRGQTYYFLKWLRCPNPTCGEQYNLEEYKRLVKNWQQDQKEMKRLIVEQKTEQLLDKWRIR